MSPVQCPVTLYKCLSERGVDLYCGLSHFRNFGLWSQKRQLRHGFWKEGVYCIYIFIYKEKDTTDLENTIIAIVVCENVGKRLLNTESFFTVTPFHAKK